MTQPLHQQVVVITGASSGIGREAALKFGQAGAKVVLAARNEMALETVATQIRDAGGDVLIVSADVSDWDSVNRIAEMAVTTFGRIDTWVNDAATSIYSLVDETSVEEFERVLEVNLLGTIYGVKAVLPYMQQQGSGTIINIGSVLSQRAVPLQAAYVASKHGVKGFTDALRLELARDFPTIQVTLIMPASINTPFFSHARSNMETEAAPLPPVYEPGLVADAILHAAQTPRREIYVGGASKLFALMERISPALTDRLMLINNWSFELQKSKRPEDGRDSMFAPSLGTGRVEGDFKHLTKPSMYTRMVELVPGAGGVILSALLVGVVMLFGRARRRAQQPLTLIERLREYFDELRSNVQRTTR